MGDITNAKLLYVKGAIFLVGGIMAAAIILIDTPSLKTAVLLGIAIWCFARAYYFVFYVIEHYIDGAYKFSGLWSFVMYLRNNKAQGYADKKTSQ